MKWKELLIIDLIYVIQFTLFIDWYYPRNITLSCVTYTSEIFLMFLLDILALLEMIIFYLLLTYNVVKAFKE